MKLVYWSVFLSSRSGGDGVKGVEGGNRYLGNFYLFFSTASLPLDLTILVDFLFIYLYN